MEWLETRWRLGVVLLAAMTAEAFAGPLPLGAVLGDVEAEGFAVADAPRSFAFPRDHGAHPRYRSEWWYLTASLETADGDAYGVQFTLFRQALRPEALTGGPWDPRQVYLGHLAVTDVAGRRHLEAERWSRGHPRLAGVTADPFAAHVDGWRLAADGPGLVGLGLSAATAEFGVDLDLEPAKPIVLQGDAGLSAKGPGQASYYYSLPRLAVRGELTIAGDVRSVSGVAWFDREWSTSVLSGGQVGWDWFGLHLDSGAELMLYQIRSAEGGAGAYDHGLWVDPAGAARRLHPGDFALEPIDFWQDADGTRWPVAWRIRLPGVDGSGPLVVRAAIDDQRMDTLLTYWEGLVRVEDADGQRRGTGYMELTGYD